MQIPEPGDLISIVAETDGVLISGNENSDNKKYRKFGWSIVRVASEQNGLVLECYKPNALSNRLPAKAPDEALRHQQEKVAKKVSPDLRPPYNNVPNEIVMLVVAIGEHIIEMVFDPDCIQLLRI
tara:strand:- start:71 stop:445 length:375 start_codon:yes stop_codon:yes gene_type:complete